jgi:hypothetical protein
VGWSESSRENGEMQVLAGLADGHGLGRFACDSPAGLAGLPSKAHYKTANAHRCPLDFFLQAGKAGSQVGLRPFTSLLHGTIASHELGNVGNISSGNRPLHANYGNFNLSHSILIQGRAHERWKG